MRRDTDQFSFLNVKQSKPVRLLCLWQVGLTIGDDDLVLSISREGGYEHPATTTSTNFLK